MDIFFTKLLHFKQEVTLVLDRCSKIKMTESGNYDQSQCLATGKTPGRNKFLNVNTPLQLGGMSNTDVKFPKIRVKRGFSGCIKNVVQDGRVITCLEPCVKVTNFNTL